MKNILIISTQPYSLATQARTYDSYFHNFKKDNLMQIFSDAKTPNKGHCSLLYQITDKRLLKRHFYKNVITGKLFKDEFLSDDYVVDKHQKNKFSPSYKGPLYRFARKFIWKKKYWNTQELENIVDTFKPNYIFLCLSKDFFIFDIALHFSCKCHIPIILCVTDDYIFHDEYRFHPLNHLYRNLYLKEFNEVLKRTKIGIFCTNKIKDKYTKELGIKGETIYLSSDIVPIMPINIDLSKDWYYFGNLEYGRLNSLKSIANELFKRKSNIKLHVYSKDIKKTKTNIPNLILHYAISYSEVKEKMQDAGALIVVEDFKKKNLNMVRYSLSTKIGDSLCSGRPIIAFGPNGAGAIDFLLENNAAYVATNNDELSELIDKILNGFNDKEIYNNQFKIAKDYFDVNIQSNKFIDIAESLNKK